VLLNLVINAMDAMKGRGTVTVRTWVMEGWSPDRRSRCAGGRRTRRRWTNKAARGRRRDGRRRRGCRDRHRGRDPAGDLPLLFDPFFTTKEPGRDGAWPFRFPTIVEGAGGEIRAESEEGRGRRSSCAAVRPRNGGSGGEKGSHG